LRRNNDNRTATAKALGLSRMGLYKKMKKLGSSGSPPIADSLAIRDCAGGIRSSNLILRQS